ncbi:hypothetical protein MSAN_01227700 [Mycena sanguinolenta]|uniref:Uncharacterized protein n=1 Tax=Mycena sanguinolenta TaxID=230812 RepID=A0A8H6YD48_9AGAR|nr:hypothetical protein MSAN_01227700 [Mycena sanguinolenta]
MHQSWRSSGIYAIEDEQDTPIPSPLNAPRKSRDDENLNAIELKVLKAQKDREEPQSEPDVAVITFQSFSLLSFRSDPWLRFPASPLVPPILSRKPGRRLAPPKTSSRAFLKLFKDPGTGNASGDSDSDSPTSSTVHPSSEDLRSSHMDVDAPDAGAERDSSTSPTASHMRTNDDSSTPAQPSKRHRREPQYAETYNVVKGPSPLVTPSPPCKRRKYCDGLRMRRAGSSPTSLVASDAFAASGSACMMAFAVNVKISDNGVVGQVEGEYGSSPCDVDRLGEAGGGRVVVSDPEDVDVSLVLLPRKYGLVVEADVSLDGYCAFRWPVYLMAVASLYAQLNPFRLDSALVGLRPAMYTYPDAAPEFPCATQSGFSPVMTSYGDFGAVFFIGVRLRSQTAYMTARPQNDFGSPLARRARLCLAMVPLRRSAAPLLRCVVWGQLASRALRREVFVEDTASVFLAVIGTEDLDVDALLRFIEASKSP